MSIATLVLGQSGTGKSTSLRHLNPNDVLLIQAIKKPLPFRSKDWKALTKEGGSIYVSDNSEQIINVMRKCTRPIIIIDDMQYIMANEYMRRSQETGFAKFTEIGRKTWEIFNAASQLADDKRVYLLSPQKKATKERQRSRPSAKCLMRKSHSREW